MAYRSNSSDVTPWQQRSQSSSMRSYGQDYSPMGSYGQRYSPVGNYSQDYGSNGGFIMDHRAYDERNSYYVNQMGRNAYDTRDSYFLNQMGLAAYDVPARYRNERPGRNQASRGRKPVNGKRLPQRNPETEPPSKRPKVQEKTEKKNDKRKKRSFRGRRRQAKNLTERNLDGYEILKVPEDDVELKKEEIVDNQETTEVKGTEEKKEVKKFRACHVCKVASSHPELMIQHNNSEEHKSKIEAALAEKQEKKTAEGDKGKVQKKANFCRLCNVTFTGSFVVHRRSSDHQRIRDNKYPRCRPCSAGFGSAEEYRDHIKSDIHKQKSAEFHHSKKLPIGFDNDEAALEPVKVEEEEPKEDETKVKEEPKAEAMETDDAEEKKTEDGVKAEGDKETDEKKEKKEEETKKVEEKKPKEPNPTGVSFVVEVHGFYCKLCRKFFKDGSVAKKRHCFSVMHHEAYKQVMEIALKDEEERQRIAEAHAKAEAEAAEAAKLAAEIAAVQREAQKTEQPKEEKDEGIEMSPADEQEKPAEVKQEVKDETSLPEKKEQTEEMCT